MGAQACAPHHPHACCTRELAHRHSVSILKKQAPVHIHIRPTIVPAGRLAQLPALFTGAYGTAADGPISASPLERTPVTAPSRAEDDDLLLGPDIFPQRPEDDEGVTGAIFGGSTCKSVFEVLISNELFTFKDLLRVRFSVW